jgi:hypothetical protein
MNVIRTSYGAWQQIEQMLERGDEGFLKALDFINDLVSLLEDAPPEFADEPPDQEALHRRELLARRWYESPRLECRGYLVGYLLNPTNAWLQPVLWQCLFRLAQAAGDDEAIGYFLLSLDRTLRREWRRHESEWVSPPEPRVVPNPRWWRGAGSELAGQILSGLREKAWEYFHALGRDGSLRHVTALATMLERYHADDLRDDDELLDNYGLMHALYGQSDAVILEEDGWHFLPGRSWASLRAAPDFPELWKDRPDLLLRLVRQARSHQVRAWAFDLLESEAGRLQGLPVSELLEWLSDPSPAVVRRGLALLEERVHSEKIGRDVWLAMLAASTPETFSLIKPLVERWLKPDQIALPLAVDFAMRQPEHLALFAAEWLLQMKLGTESECQSLLRLTACPFESVRHLLIPRVAALLAAFSERQPGWLIQFIQNNYPDVREVGRHWFMTDAKLREQTLCLWPVLAESIHADVRRHFRELLSLPEPTPDVASTQSIIPDGEEEANWMALDALASRAASPARPAAPASSARQAALRSHRPALPERRTKRPPPRWSRRASQAALALARQLEQTPDRTGELLPQIAEILQTPRSDAGWRAALAAVIRLWETRPEFHDLIQTLLPGLRIRKRER